MNRAGRCIRTLTFILSPTGRGDSLLDELFDYGAREGLAVAHSAEVGNLAIRFSDVSVSSVADDVAESQSQRM